MGQKITIKILDRRFPLEAESQEQEKDIREAAEKVDGKYHEYLSMFPDKSPEEILSFVALNGYMEVTRLQKAMDVRDRDEESLQARLRSYLENIDK